MHTYKRPKRDPRIDGEYDPPLPPVIENPTEEDKLALEALLLKYRVRAETASHSTELENGNYDDIINLPHHTSTRRPRMSMEARAAQFAPFAALTGYDAAVKEVERLTDQKLILSEDEIARLDEKLRWIGEHLNEQVDVRITYFVPDKRKDGGSYQTTTSPVLHIDTIYHHIHLLNGTIIPIDDILHIEIED